MRQIRFLVILILFGVLNGAPQLLVAQGSAVRSTAEETHPVMVGAGDIASCGNPGAEATAQLLDTLAGTIYTLGDHAYPDGTATDFANCYAPTWGRHKTRTKPTVGNHDYSTAGAAGYYAYFGSAASPLEHNCVSNCQGYYSYALGSWHIVVLNSEITVDAGSGQEQWLRDDLAAHSNVCTLAYWHRPRFSSGIYGNDPTMQAIWQALYDYRADVVVNGHIHNYERFDLQTPTGEIDTSQGIREFVVGTGGAELHTFGTIQPNSQVRSSDTYGVLKFTLHATSYDWEFIPIAGQSFRDSGSGACVTYSPTAPDPPPTTPYYLPGIRSSALFVNFAV